LALSRFRVFLSDVSSKTPQKTFYKKIVSKVFTKNRQKSKILFFSILFYHVFGRFSVRGVQKYDKKSQKNLPNPGTFLASEEQTNHVKARRFFV
jgi:hypothetical protein